MDRSDHVNILAFCPDRADVTSFYRAVGPLNHLARNNPKINIKIANDKETGWDHLQWAHVCLVQRPALESHQALCRNVKLSGRLLWIDYDDHLFDVPKANPAWAYYSQKKTRDIISHCIASADLLTVSTQKLLEVYAPLAKSDCVVATVLNGYDSDLFSYHGRRLADQKPILWMRGSRTHDEDVHDCADGLAAALNANPKWGFISYGFNPWRITSQIAPAQWLTKVLPMTDYYHDTHQSRLGVMVVPLSKNEFNQGKSNIAALEGCMAGSIVVAPAYLKEFGDLPGAILFDEGRDEVKDAVQYAMSILNTDEGRSNIQKMRAHFLSKTNLSLTNAQRLKLIAQARLQMRSSMLTSH